MFQYKNLQIKRIEKSMEMLRVVILVHLGYFFTRLINILILEFIWTEQNTSILNSHCNEICKRPSAGSLIMLKIGPILSEVSRNHFWIAAMFGYICILLFLLFNSLPQNAIISSLTSKDKVINKEEIYKRKRLLKIIGYCMILGNTIIISFKDWIDCLTNLSTIRLSEVYLFNIMISIFIIKEANLCICINTVEVLLINLVNFCIIGSYDSWKVLFSSFTSLMISSILVLYCLREDRDSHDTKKELQDQMNMMRKILEFFPSGILFFKNKECAYKNKFWDNLVDTTICPGNEAENPSQQMSEFDRSYSLLGKIINVANESKSLTDEIMEIHTRMKSQVTKNAIKKNGFVTVKTKRNSDVFEFELNNNSGKQISEFAIKFSIYEFSPHKDTFLMMVVDDISNQMKTKETKIYEQLKAVMLCSISHELRSPINQLNGTLTLLEESISSSENYLLKIARSSTEILKLKVDDILDFSEIETQNFKLITKGFNPRELILELNKIFSPMVDSSKTHLYFIINERTPAIVQHDFDRLKQILANFLSNAVKYCKAGRITLRIDWESTNERCGFLKFSISDTGIGIPMEKRKNLFNFLDPEIIKNLLKTQGQKTTNLAGTGLGISAKIIQQMGSRINYISTEGEGTKFWFKVMTERESVKQEDIYRTSSFEIPIEDFQDVYNSSNIQVDDQKEIGADFNQISYTPASAIIETGKLCTTEEILNYFEENHSYGVDLNAQTFSYEDFAQFDRSVYSDDDNNAQEGTDPRKFYKEKEKRLHTLSIFRDKKKTQERWQKFNERAFSLDLCDVPDEGSVPKILTYVSTSSRPSKPHQKSGSLVIKGLRKDTKKSRFFQCNTVNIQTNSLSKQQKKNNDLSESSFSEDICKPRTRNFITEESENLHLDISNKKLFDANNLAKIKRKKTSGTQNTLLGKVRHFSPAGSGPHFFSLEGIATESEDYISPRFCKDCKCPSVLIVDDQYINRFIIKQFCERYKIKWVEAEDGKEALEMIRNQNKNHCCQGFELVLMDLNMPVMGGIEAAIEIMKMKDNFIIPPTMRLVAVTAFSSKTEEDKCLEVGFDKFITKPFRISHFLKLISE
ncbi:unnamed protein product [Moneuplotes crassus]|uniref:Uncharacterized protein n=1 Tax=Euplotes crassus TaxID=5936 RepID=A0AAD1UFC4_EUPCR|nr:unnamed protein product [Moneuplotes crassus]